MKINIIVTGLFLVALVLISGCTKGTASPTNGAAVAGDKITVFKSASCGCCEGYISELKKNGFSVETVISTDLTAIKVAHNIPSSMQSCHTAIIGDYFIEGHVPIEAVRKLLAEKPDVDGIILPRMPSGSPGMPGEKTAPFEVYTLKDGVTSEYITI